MRSTVRFTPEDRARTVYHYVPFEVPPGTAEITVRLDYDTSRAVVDLGAFDPEGFRGWSGAARDGYTISVQAATPGYLPGPIPSGTWRVALGLHRVPTDGVVVSVDVERSRAASEPPPASPPPPAPERPPRRQLPARPGHRWLAADLHSHSVHSDGALTLDQLAVLAAARGLDVLAVTDHNTTSHHPHLATAGRRAGIQLLPGQEVTSDTGHANCFGDIGWIDFRESADGWRDTADARGGLFSINHPLAGDCAWRRPLDTLPHLTELWHSSWDRRSHEPFELWRSTVGVVGGSDFHRPGDDALPGAPTTWIEARDGEDVLAALRQARTAVSADAQGPVLLRRGDTVIAVDGEGLDLRDPRRGRHRVTSRRHEFPAGPGLYWLADREGVVHALTA